MNIIFRLKNVSCFIFSLVIYLNFPQVQNYVIEDYSQWTYNNDFLNISPHELIYRTFSTEKDDSFIIKTNISSNNFNLTKCKKNFLFEYSFEYFTFYHFDEYKIGFEVNYFNMKKNLNLLTDQWVKSADSIVNNKEEFKNKFSNKIDFSLNITFSQFNNLENLKKILIKNLYVQMKCEDYVKKYEFENSIYKSENEFSFFEVIKNEKKLDTEQVMKYWSNKYHPQLNDEIRNFYYTDVANANLSLKLENHEKLDFLCLSFNYFIAQNAILNLFYVSTNEQNQTLFKLYPTLDENSNSILSFEWDKAKFCLPITTFQHKFIFNCYIKNNSYKDHLCAITNFESNFLNKKINYRDYLINWEYNGKFANQTWSKLNNLNNLNANLKENNLTFIYLNKKDLFYKASYLFSEWFYIRPNYDYLSFKLNSNLSNHLVSVSLYSDLLELIYFKNWPPKNNEQILIKLLDNDYNEKILAQLIIKIYNKKFINEVEVENKLIRNENNFTQNYKNKNEFLMLSELKLADHCANSSYCSINGLCKTKSANNSFCECSLYYTGKACEYLNMCTQKNINNEETGDDYCKKYRGGKCIPYKNIFNCEIDVSDNFKLDKIKYSEINSCLIKTCNLNEVCNPNKNASCECKKNYYRNEDSECIYDICNLDGKYQCESNEKCLSILGERKPICYCYEGFKKDEKGKCIPISEEYINPFFLQKYECSQKYEFLNNKIVCSCYDGYVLDEDKKNCILSNDFDYKYCECNSNQICYKNAIRNKKEDYGCACKAGYLDDNCENSICDNDNRFKNQSCGKNAFCEIYYDFECKCDKNLHEINDYNFCKRKNLCDENSCQDKNSICYNKVVNDDNSLNSLKIRDICLCKPGLFPHENGCVFACNLSSCQDTLNSECEYNVYENKIQCNCKKGYYRKNIDGECEIVNNLISIQANVAFKDLDVLPTFLKLENYNLDKNSKYFNYDLLNYAECDIFNDYEDCIKDYNRLYKFLIDLNEEILLNDYIKFLLKKALKNSFKNIISEKNLDFIYIDKYESTKIFDAKNYGLGEIFKVNFTIQSREINLNKNSIIDYIKKNCKNIKEDQLNDWCFLEPNLVIYGDKKINDDFDFCSINIQCGAYSECKKSLDLSNETLYECKCKNGYKSIHVRKDASFWNHTCSDINECESNNNLCDKNSICINLDGSYICQCNKSYKNLDQFTCKKFCDVDFKCVHGKCHMINEKEEICICNDGYKGDACDELNEIGLGYEKIKLNLKLSLIIVSIVFSSILILLIFLFITYNKRYIKKNFRLQFENIQLELKKYEDDKINRDTNHKYKVDKNVPNENAPHSNFARSYIVKEGKTNPTFSNL